MRTKNLVLLVLCILAPAILRAEVTDSAPNGFTVKIATVVHASYTEVYGRLVHDVGDWWSPDHTYSQDAHNLSLDDKPMGCFCEKLPNNGGVRFAQVILVMPNKMLILSGGLGPLQRMGATGTLTIVVTPLHNDARVELTYAVGGYLPDGLNTWAAPVDKVLTEQVTRLKNYVETGNPVPAADKKQP